MMVLASIYLYVSGSLPTTSSIKPVEVWLIFNLVYPCLIILSNVLYQVNDNFSISTNMNPKTGSCHSHGMESTCNLVT